MKTAVIGNALGLILVALGLIMLAPAAVALLAMEISAIPPNIGAAAASLPLPAGDYTDVTGEAIHSAGRVDITAARTASSSSNGSLMRCSVSSSSTSGARMSA